MGDDIDDLIRWSEKQGFSVSIDANGYRRFYAPEGDYVTRYPATPSNPRRRFVEVKNALKKHGLEWPPPSKSELRARRRKEGQR